MWCFPSLARSLAVSCHVCALGFMAVWWVEESRASEQENSKRVFLRWQIVHKCALCWAVCSDCIVHKCAALTMCTLHCGHCETQIVLFTRVHCAPQCTLCIFQQCALWSPDCIVEKWAGLTIEPRAQQSNQFLGLMSKILQQLWQNIWTIVCKKISQSNSGEGHTESQFLKGFQMHQMIKEFRCFYSRPLQDKAGH